MTGASFMQRYPEKSSIISYLFCAVITTLEAKSKLNGWKIRSMTNNGRGYEHVAGFGARPYPTRQKLPARRGAEYAENPAIAYEPVLCGVNFFQYLLSSILSAFLSAIKIYLSISLYYH